MSTGEMNLIIKVARQKSPAKHYVVLNMGTNNIRNYGEHPEYLLCYFKEIAEEHHTLENISDPGPALILVKNADETGSGSDL